MRCVKSIAAALEQWAALMFVCVNVFMSVWVHMCLRPCMCVSVFVCVCMCGSLCMSVCGSICEGCVYVCGMGVFKGPGCLCCPSCDRDM